jgi:hypothetical protein
MEKTLSNANSQNTRLAMLCAGATLLFLLLLHLVSPEFDPSWRMVSEYALGKFKWVLTLMFFSWAIAKWGLAAGLWKAVDSFIARTGVILLIVSGIGAMLGGLFDVRQEAMHGVAVLLGVPTEAIAATILSVHLVRRHAWVADKKLLLAAAAFTWISLVLMGLGLALMMKAFADAGIVLNGTAPANTPPDAFLFSGWANRFLIFCSCAWLIVTARQVAHKQTMQSRFC